MKKLLLLMAFFCHALLPAQEYFLKNYEPFNSEIPSPEAFLGYGIGEMHTRHDLIVSYLEKLAEVSDRASISYYGKTHEGRKLVMLNISTPEQLDNLEDLRQKHLALTQPENRDAIPENMPVFINLAYNVHGNEPSSSEAALLTTYTLVASEHPAIAKYREQAVIFVDPTINPDGRDRHTQWANSFRADPLVADPQDAEHNEMWPAGRTNHYWFDLNRDWLLGINPESRGKLNWYHHWYPNVVTDFHEMGTQSTYFFEPMKPNGSLEPIMPKENYEDLNTLFGNYFAASLDSIGSLYFTKEVFDGTYPGYGSSYPDLQGGLGLLFEQASSRGHKQTTAYGEITFPFTIRNQFVSGMTTVKAAVENKDYLMDYQRRFFRSALSNADNSRIQGYSFNAKNDQNRIKAFIDKLLLHRIKVYKSTDGGYVVPTKQPQYRMVQTMFETYDKYRDSVYYDASAWSVANFYNMNYKAVNSLKLGDEITDAENVVSVKSFDRSEYAYILDWDDYNTPAALYYLQKNGLVLASAFKPFTVKSGNGTQKFNYGSLVLPVQLQEKDSQQVYELLKEAQQKFQIPVHTVSTGLNISGVDLGSRFVKPLSEPKVAMLIGNGVRSYEAGEVWHLLDTRVHMPITKIPMRNLGRVDLGKYETLVMVSGNYQLSDTEKDKIISWVKQGNTLVTIGSASEYIIEKKWVKEQLTKVEKDSLAVPERLPYVDADEHLGKESVGGIILKTSLDVTHPLGFGYRDEVIPVYKNNEVWLAPSKNEYATVAKYTSDPHIDGFITERNMEQYLKPSASLITSPLGSGRVVMFADNPNFRGSWYGTNKLFLNALFLGEHIEIPN
ncbi:M14 family metallopeptidase [Zeaxanthinibacter sp. PT1]|uniref:M14 family metallopeptidase n=1 Tax=Zeaxanthinibacter TaxID=561554 RepID=UPI00234B1000|nr:M14 family metallopeptidase [Zeaxanthinibacter sp. PT1]MDC6352113.1 M14 family metallopeptidase [Zeaxanthinibacter sp. PT1]